MSKTLVLQSQLARFQTLADGSVRLIFDCGEESPENFKTIGALNKKVGVLVFKADQDKLSEQELKEIEKFKTSGMVKIDPRSKSQRLRAALFHYYNDQSESENLEVISFEDFEAFYGATMNKIINWYEAGYKNS